MKYHQSGNVLFYILIAVALLAALSYAVTQGGRTGVRSVTRERANVYASEIIEYGNILSQSVSQIRLRGYQDTEISFENNIVSGYINANCTDDECKIFHVNGGGLNFLRPPMNANDGVDWLFSVNRVIYVGTHIGGVATSDLELVAVLQNIDKGVCEQINRKLHGTSVIPQENDSINLVKFTGAYSGAWIADSGGASGPIAGNSAYCFEGNVDPPSGTYHYYQVIIAR